MNQVITIMADFGMGPYAWGKDSLSERGVGPNIADAVGGFDEEYGVPESLEERFGSWSNHFGREYDTPHFDWAEFHERGRQLASELKSVLGPNFTVIYEKPFEAPDRHIDERTIIE